MSLPDAFSLDQPTLNSGAAIPNEERFSILAKGLETFTRIRLSLYERFDLLAGFIFRGFARTFSSAGSAVIVVIEVMDVATFERLRLVLHAQKIY